MTLLNIEPGKNIPKEFTVIIEIPKGSKVKYELDKETGFIKVDRILSTNVGYPQNYGLVPKTLFEDGDPLDVIVIADYELSPGSIVTVRPIGVLKMIDCGEQDDKIICLIKGDPKTKHIEDITKLHKKIVDEVKEFFGTYKIPEGKTTEVTSIEGKEIAFEIINKSVKAYASA